MSVPGARVDAACAIIAGGMASRFGGQVKALIEIDGKSILSRLLEVLEPRFSELVVAANDPAPYADTGLPVVADEVPGQGPLAGIAAALRWCRRPYLFAIACDMPYPSIEVVDLLLSRRAPGVDIVVPMVGELPEPLCALYHRRCLPVLEERLQSGRRKASGLITDGGLGVARVYEPELRAIDAELGFLTNINTASDLP